MTSVEEKNYLDTKPVQLVAATVAVIARGAKEFKADELCGIARGYIKGDKIDGFELDEKMAALANELGEINGQDAYNTTDAILGKLNKSEYLLLPEGYQIPEVKAEEVGTPKAAEKFSLSFLAQVYSLNKTVVTDDQVRFALARMEAVKMGWFDAHSQKEFRFVKKDPEAIKTFVTDLSGKEFEIATAQKVAWLTPLAAEYVFRTLGHHYVDTTAATYKERYKRIFDSSLEPACANYLAGSTQFHKAFHWIGPRRIRAVLEGHSATGAIPDAIALRKSAAPAGTAVITTTAAVLEATKSSGFFDVLKTESKCDLELIIRTAQVIKADPPKYHRVPQAYGRAPLSADDAKEMERVKAEAIKFAPIAQAFIDALLGKAALGKAVALKKHALENPVLHTKLVRIFRKLARAECNSLTDAFKTSLALATPNPATVNVPVPVASPVVVR